jgi:hypothetical protein
MRSLRGNLLLLLLAAASLNSLNSCSDGDSGPTGPPTIPTVPVPTATATAVPTATRTPTPACQRLGTRYAQYRVCSAVADLPNPFPEVSVSQVGCSFVVERTNVFRITGLIVGDQIAWTATLPSPPCPNPVSISGFSHFDAAAIFFELGSAGRITLRSTPN